MGARKNSNAGMRIALLLFFLPIPASALYICGHAENKYGLIFQGRPADRGDLILMGPGGYGAALPLLCAREQDALHCGPKSPREEKVAVILREPANEAEVFFGVDQANLRCRHVFEN